MSGSWPDCPAARQDGAGHGPCPAPPDPSTRKEPTIPMADIDVRGRAPGVRPWIVGILLLAALAAAGLWLLDERADDRALEGVSAPAE